MVIITEEITIEAPAEEVWALVAAAERQAEWFPGMTSSTVEGTVRTIGTAAGGILLEEILDIDHERRRFEYRITGPMQFDHHLGSIEVHEVDGAKGASRVVYGQELEPTALAYVMVIAATMLILDQVGVAYGFTYGLALTAVSTVCTVAFVFHLDRGRIIQGAAARKVPVLEESPAAGG